MKKRIFILFFLITELFLLMNEPYALKWFFSFPGLPITGSVFLVISTFFAMQTWGKLPGIFSRTFVITILAWTLYAIIYEDTSYLTRVFLLICTYNCLSYLYSSGSFNSFWVLNNRFILLQTFLSAIAFFLIIFHLISPLITITSLNDDGVLLRFDFWGLCCSKTAVVRFIRSSGYFDEPGALAAWAVYGLLINYAFIKDKLIDRYLPWLSALTLSLAYFVQIILYYCARNIRSFYKLIPLALILLVGYFYLVGKGQDSDIYNLTIGRLEYDADRGFAGNNRQEQMNAAYIMFKSSPLIGIGASNFSEREEIASDNPYEILGKDGIIGYIITYLPLIMILFYNRRKEVLICILVLFVGYQQRPFHVNFMHYLYLWSLFLFCINEKRIRIV